MSNIDYGVPESSTEIDSNSRQLAKEMKEYELISPSKVEQAFSMKGKMTACV